MNFEHTVLRPRADATSSSSLPTRSDGCVICPSTMASCPKCPSGQECILRARTCSTCPEYVCVDSSTGSSSSTPVGGIVGGVVGGVVVILVVLGLYYALVYRKKKALTNEINLDDESYFGSASVGNHGFEDDSASAEKERPRASRQQSSQSLGKQAQISSYDSFMRPPGYHKRGNRVKAMGGALGAGAGVAGNGVGGNGVGGNSAGLGGLGAPGGVGAGYSDKRRFSMETTASTTNASNILPIAYIPGVTIRATRNNTGSIYSTEDSVFSDLTGIDNASIVHQQSAGPQLRSTMTAIKAQPRLVNVGKIDEDEEEDDDVSQSHDTSTGSAWNQSSSTAWNQSSSTAWNQDNAKTKTREAETTFETNTIESNAYESNGQGFNFESTDVFESAEALADSDSDVDSDIGEIHRATSTRREREMRTETESVDAPDDESIGSFTLDIGR